MVNYNGMACFCVGERREFFLRTEAYPAFPRHSLRTPRWPNDDERYLLLPPLLPRHPPCTVSRSSHVRDGATLLQRFERFQNTSIPGTATG